MNECEKTPEGRIAAPAWDLMFKNKGRGSTTHVLELRDEIAPYVQLEIQSAVLKAVQKYGTFRESMEILTKIEDLKKVIATRKT
ncbi:MAG: hypothetical protein LAO08_20250 [Acidobacteriia bacterium]|nr:hypothetical protein [Terriglobia bacterium]